MVIYGVGDCNGDNDCFWGKRAKDGAGEVLGGWDTCPCTALGRKYI